MADKKYYGWMSNDQGATCDVDMQSHGLRRLTDYIRSRFGRGWTAHIMAVDIDGDGHSVMGEPYEIKKFTLRK